MIVPFGSVPGFSLQAELREVAAHYAIDWRALRHADGRQSELIALARHALFWKLTNRRKLTPRRVSQMLKCSAKAVREGAKLHAERIAEFRRNSGITGRDERHG